MRDRFPSDEKRLKSRPHAKIHLTCRSHPRYGHVFENPEHRGIVWGLWLLAVQYHAPDDGGRVTLGRGDLAWLSGRTQWAFALNALRTVCELMDYPLTVEGQRVTVTIRNLQRKQGFASARRGATPRTHSTPEAEAEAEAESAASPPATPDSGRGEIIPISTSPNAESYAFVPATHGEIGQAANVLNAQKGSREDHLDWMTENIDQLRAECARDKQANDEGFVSRAIRYYRAHRKTLKREADGHRPWAEKDSDAIKRELFEDD